MKAFKDRENRSFDVLLGLKMGVGDALRVGSYIFEEPGDATQALVKVMPFL